MSLERIPLLFRIEIKEFHNVALDVITLKNLFSLKGFVVLLLTLISSAKLHNLLLIIFVFLYLMDFCTGVLASVIESNGKPKDENKRLFWLDSKKIMRGVVKLLVYLQIITLSFVTQKMLVKPNFVIHELFLPLSVVELTLSVCIASEFVSNLENAKRAGFDIVSKLTDIWVQVCGVVTSIKGKRNESNRFE